MSTPATPTSAVPDTLVPSGSPVSPSGPLGPPGITGPTGPTTVSTDANNVARLGNDNLIYVPTPYLIAQDEAEADTLSQANPTILVFYPEA